MKLRAVAAAVALAMGSSAYAAIDTGIDDAISAGGRTVSDDPEVFLAVWDASGDSLGTRLVDLGLNLRTFDWDSNFQVSGLNFSDLGTDLRWAVLGGSTPASGDFNNRLGFTTNPSFDGTVFVGDTSLSEIQINISNLGTMVNAVEHAGTMPDNALDLTTTALAGRGTIPGQTLGYAGFLIDATTSQQLSNAGLFGQALDFYLSVHDYVSATTTQLGSGRQWTLSADGSSLNWSAAPIPLPAGVWLLGSALLGLVGVARRRRSIA